MRCFKCQDAAAVIASREGAKKSYCIECFLDITHRNVRDTFFKNCRIPPETPIVLCVSGGFNSMAMMHILGLLRVQNIMRRGTGRIFFDMHVLHLEDDGRKDTAIRGGIASTITKLATSPAPVNRIPDNNNKPSKKKKNKNKNNISNENNEGVTKYTTEETLSPIKLKETEGTLCSDPPIPSLFPSSNIHIKPLSNYYTAPPNLSSNGNSSDLTGPPLSVTEDLYFSLHRKAILAAARDVAMDAVRQQRKGIDENAREYSDDMKIPSIDSKDNGSIGVTTIGQAPYDDQNYYVLLGDSAVHCAINALYETIRGRGASIVDTTGFCGFLHWDGLRSSSDDICRYCHIRRPMRNTFPKESIFYTRTEGIYWEADTTVSPLAVNSIVQRSSGAVRGPPAAVKTHRASLYRILESFVINLCGPFKATIFNILNSVEKLSLVSLELNGQAKEKQQNEIHQKRFGPKNAAKLSSSSIGDTGPDVSRGINVYYGTTPEVLKQQQSCTLCGGRLPLPYEGLVSSLSDTTKGNNQRPKYGCGVDGVLEGVESLQGPLSRLVLCASCRPLLRYHADKYLVAGSTEERDASNKGEGNIPGPLSSFIENALTPLVYYGPNQCDIHNNNNVLKERDECEDVSIIPDPPTQSWRKMTEDELRKEIEEFLITDNE
eukprot:Tbor_TRINITY_DN4486_c0_g2::TRINITY_DN4486_c0_g2_i1::g.7931::m.7931